MNNEDVGRTRHGEGSLHAFVHRASGKCSAKEIWTWSCRGWR